MGPASAGPSACPEPATGLAAALPQTDTQRGIIGGMIESSNTLLRWLYELEEQEPTHEPFVSSKLAKALKETNGWDENTTLGLIAGLNSKGFLEKAERRKVKGRDGREVEALEVLHFAGLSHEGRQAAQSLPESGLG